MLHDTLHLLDGFLELIVESLFGVEHFIGSLDFFLHSQEFSIPRDAQDPNGGGGSLDNVDLGSGPIHLHRVGAVISQVPLQGKPVGPPIALEPHL